MAKVIAVVGVSNPLGCMVMRVLSNDPSYKVRVVLPCNSTESVDIPCTCETVSADLNNLQSLRSAMKGAYGAFIVTSSDHTDQGKEVEVQQGKNLADACNSEGLQYIIFCTQLSVIDTLGISARHMDAKATVEKYMKSLGLPLTCVILPCCFEGLLTIWKPHPLSPNSFELTIPMGSTPLDMVSVEDAGQVVHEIFQSSNHFLHKTVSLSADKLTIKHMAATLSRQLEPYSFRDKQLTVAQYRGLMSHMNSNDKSGEDFANMFDFFVRVDQRCSIDLTKKLYPGLLNFEQWVERHRDQIISALQKPPPKLAKYWT